MGPRDLGGRGWRDRPQPLDAWSPPGERQEGPSPGASRECRVLPIPAVGTFGLQNRDRMSDCSQAVQRVASCPGGPRTLLHSVLGKLVRCLLEALRPSGAALPAPSGHLYCQRPTWGLYLGLAGPLLSWGSRRGPGPWRGEPSRPSASTSTGCRWLWGDVQHSALVREESLEERSCAHPMGGPPTPRMIRESNPTWRRETTGTPSISSRAWDRLSLDT